MILTFRTEHLHSCQIIFVSSLFFFNQLLSFCIHSFFSCSFIPWFIINIWPDCYSSLTFWKVCLFCFFTPTSFCLIWFLIFHVLLYRRLPSNKMFPSKMCSSYYFYAPFWLYDNYMLKSRENACIFCPFVFCLLWFYLVVSMLLQLLL